MKSHATRNEEIERTRKDYELGGGQDAIDRIHSKGRLTARERIKCLVDPGSFQEFNLWAQPTKTGFDIDKRKSPGDAVVTGFAQIDGRSVCVYAHDFSTLGGSQASVQNWKICKTINTAVQLGVPYIGIIDSGGVRIQEAFGFSTGWGISNNGDVWYAPSIASGVVPSISLALGASYAGTAYSPFLADVFFMVNKPYCYMSLSSPELLKSVTFKDVTRDEIGAPKLHAEVTGSCDYLGETEEEVLHKARELLSFLPSNNKEKPPFRATNDKPQRRAEKLTEIVSADIKQHYDMKEVIRRIVDSGYFLELKPDYAKNIVTGFARLGGHSIGIVANNPLFLDGAIDLRAAEKEARFIRYCNAFNVPLVFLVDTPGVVTDLEQEKAGLSRHLAMTAYALCEASVPKISIYLRRSFNNGHIFMGNRWMGTDRILCWPIAEIETVDFEQSLEDISGIEFCKTTLEERDKCRKEFFNSPINPTSLLFADDIIDARDTRYHIYNFLQLTKNKEQKALKRKHGNIPV